MPVLRAQRPEVPEAAERALQRAMALDPADRFASVADFIRALGAAAATPASGVPAISEPTAEAPAAPDAPSSGRAWLAPRVLVPAALALVAALAIGAIALRSGATSGSGNAAANTRLAVLPFDNLGDSTNAYFADGMADAIRGKLTELDRLQVIARESSTEYRGSTKSPQEIGKELGARYLLTGTVRWARGNDGTSRVEVSPELVDLGAGAAPTSRWQESFDASPTDVFKVQSDIAGKVADALDVALGAGEQDALRQRPTENLPAYDAYLQGEAVRAASADLDSYRRAAAHYQDAVNRDPAFALAWARLAGARSSLYAYGTPDPALARGARDALARARSLAPGSTATAIAECSVQLDLNHDPAAALAAVEPALAAAPNDAMLLRLVAVAELSLGRLGPAREHAERAVALDPRTPLAFVTLGDVDARLGRWADLGPTYERAQSLERGNLLLIARRIEAHLLQGDLDGARRALAESVAGGGPCPGRRLRRRLPQHRLGALRCGPAPGARPPRRGLRRQRGPAGAGPRGDPRLERRHRRRPRPGRQRRAAAPPPARRRPARRQPARRPRPGPGLRGTLPRGDHRGRARRRAPAGGARLRARARRCGSPWPASWCARASATGRSRCSSRWCGSRTTSRRRGCGSIRTWRRFGGIRGSSGWRGGSEAACNRR